MKTAIENKKTNAENKKVYATISSKVGSYEKHPFFVKKAKETKALIEMVGLPKLKKAK